MHLWSLNLDAFWFFFAAILELECSFVGMRYFTVHIFLYFSERSMMAS